MSDFYASKGFLAAEETEPFAMIPSFVMKMNIPIVCDEKRNNKILPTKEGQVVLMQCSLRSYLKRMVTNCFIFLKLKCLTCLHFSFQELKSS